MARTIGKIMHIPMILGLIIISVYIILFISAFTFFIKRSVDRKFDELRKYIRDEFKKTHELIDFYIKETCGKIDLYIEKTEHKNN